MRTVIGRIPLIGLVLLALAMPAMADQAATTTVQAIGTVGSKLFSVTNVKLPSGPLIQSASYINQDNPRDCLLTSKFSVIVTHPSADAVVATCKGSAYYAGAFRSFTYTLTDNDAQADHVKLVVGAKTLIDGTPTDPKFGVSVIAGL